MQQTQTDISAFSEDASFLPLTVLMILASGLKASFKLMVLRREYFMAPVDGTAPALLSTHTWTMAQIEHAVLITSIVSFGRGRLIWGP